MALLTHALSPFQFAPACYCSSILLKLIADRASLSRTRLNRIYTADRSFLRDQPFAVSDIFSIPHPGTRLCQSVSEITDYGRGQLPIGDRHSRQ